MGWRESLIVQKRVKESEVVAVQARTLPVFSACTAGHFYGARLAQTSVSGFAAYEVSAP